MSMRDVHTPKRHSWTQDSSFKLDNMASLKPKTVLNICIESAFKKIIIIIKITIVSAC